MVQVPVKDARVGVRTTEDRKRVWQREAAREGMRLSEWLRALAERQVRQAGSHDRQGAASPAQSS